VVIAVVTPKSRETVSTPLDLIGGGLSVAAIGALLFAIIEVPELGLLHPMVLSSFGLAVLLVFVFVWWEVRIEYPILPMTFFRDRRFAVGSAVLTITFFLMIAFFLLLTLYLQFVLGYSALEAGIAGLPMALATVLVSPYAASLTFRIGSGAVMAAGLTVIAAASVLLTPASVSTTYPQLVPVLVLIGTGMALAGAPATANIITSVPPDKAGVGSAMNSATIELGGAVGIAAGGSLVAIIYGATIDLAPFGLPPESAHAASESIGGAFGVADGIGGRIATQIVLVAREAFTTAFAWTMGVFAVIAIVSGLATWWLMREHESGRSIEPTR
jgi:hypothetical protein